MIIVIPFRTDYALCIKGVHVQANLANILVTVSAFSLQAKPRLLFGRGHQPTWPLAPHLELRRTRSISKLTLPFPTKSFISTAAMCSYAAFVMLCDISPSKHRWQRSKQAKDTNNSNLFNFNSCARLLASEAGGNQKQSTLSRCKSIHLFIWEIHTLSC